MGLEGVLGAILPDSLIHIERHETNISIVRTGNGHAVSGISEETEKLDVSVDWDTLSPSEKAAAVEEIWEEEGEIFIDESQDEKRAIEKTSENTDVQNTLAFFSTYLEGRHFGMLKAALYLREAWQDPERHINKAEMRERKRDIAERFGDEAWGVCNLTTAGYFDEGGYIRQLFEDYEPEQAGEREGYEELFIEIVSNQPFTVFVGEPDSVKGIKENIKQRISKKQQYRVDFDFIDLRGIGPENRAKINQAVDEMDDRIEGLNHETKSSKPDLVERIYIENIDVSSF